MAKAKTMRPKAPPYVQRSDIEYIYADNLYSIAFIRGSVRLVFTVMRNETDHDPKVEQVTCARLVLHPAVALQVRDRITQLLSGIQQDMATRQPPA